jgi:hypothetical protein
MRTLGRLIWVPIAAVLSALVAAFVLVSLGQERIIQGLSGRRPDDVPLGAVWDLLKMGRALFSVQTFLPALLLIIVGEVARIRQSMYYVLGGGAALVAVPLIARLSDGSSVLGATATLWQVFATAGFAGGFFYWLLAGRNA